MRGFLIFVALFVITGLSFPTQAHGPATITIASWNVELFGETKSNDPVRLARIAKIVKEFDVIAIQGIVHKPSRRKDVVDRLTSELRSEYRRTYDPVFGPRTGCESGRIEQYAVLYDCEILELVGSTTVDDDPTATENMCRDPLVVKLKLRDTDAPFTFTLINVNTDPSRPSTLRGDLNSLGRIYQTVQANDPQDEYVILLGDLNSAPSSFWGLGNVPDLVYALPDSGTMVRGASRNDNIVFQWGVTGEDYTGRAGVSRVAQFLGISKAETEKTNLGLYHREKPVYSTH